MFLLTHNLPDLETERPADPDLFSVQWVSRMRASDQEDIRTQLVTEGHQEPDSDHIIRDGRQGIINRALSY